MKSADGAAAAAGWTRQQERSNSTSLRVMRWIALTAGRRVSRALLYAAVLYFVVGGAELRRHSRRYLDRALGRRATWRDVHRHLFTFTATVLDRVYLLRERFAMFEVEATGIETILGPVGRGEGVLECTFGRYRPVKLAAGPVPTRPRSDHNPLDRKEYLLHVARRV